MTTDIDKKEYICYLSKNLNTLNNNIKERVEFLDNIPRLTKKQTVKYLVLNLILFTILPSSAYIVSLFFGYEPLWYQILILPSIHGGLFMNMKTTQNLLFRLIDLNDNNKNKLFLMFLPPKYKRFIEQDKLDRSELERYNKLLNKYLIDNGIQFPFDKDNVELMIQYCEEKYG